MSPINTIEYHHQEHREWNSTLDFYQDEVRIFQKELEKVLLEFSDLYSIIEHVDEYRKILLKKLETIDMFRRQIALHERHLRDENLAQGDDLWEHIELREKLNNFEEAFEKFKVNFRGFVSKHLHHV